MDSNPSAVHIVDYASLPSGGVITGGKLYGGVYIHDNCTFTMESGSISGNSADYGGGVENSGRLSTGALDRKKLKLPVLP